MKKNLYYHYYGLTLVELLVGIVVGLVVLSAAGGAMMSYMRSYSDSQKILNLNQNMRAAMDLMARDIRRAGYFGVDLVDSDNSNIKNRIDWLKDNPFRDVAVYNFDSKENSCIQFSYNKDPEINALDFSFNKIEDDEFIVGNKNVFGFRLRDGVVQAKYSGNDGGGCDWSSVQPISDDDVEIKELKFTLQCWNVAGGVEVACTESSDDVLVRSVTIEMMGGIKNDTSNPAIIQTLKHTVEIRNENFYNTGS